MVAGAVDLGEDHSRVFDQRGSVERGGHPARFAFEQSGSEELLQFAQGAGGGWLGQAQGLGGAHDAAVLGDRGYQGEVAELEPAVEQVDGHWRLPFVYRFQYIKRRYWYLFGMSWNLMMLV